MPYAHIERSPVSSRSPDSIEREFAARSPQDDPAKADGDPGILIANRHLRTILQTRKYRVHSSEFSGAHDFGYWRWTFPIALKTLLAD